MSDEEFPFPKALSWWRVVLIIPLSIVSIVTLIVLVSIAACVAIPLTIVGFIILYPTRTALRWLSGPLWGRRWGLL